MIYRNKGKLILLSADRQLGNLKKISADMHRMMQRLRIRLDAGCWYIMLILNSYTLIQEKRTFNPIINVAYFVL
jgi:hypothetical protein